MALLVSGFFFSPISQAILITPLVGLGGCERVAGGSVGCFWWCFRVVCSVLGWFCWVFSLVLLGL